ncbi:MAG: 16S rRNA (cytidine1402-2'-O)-methyltransferase [Crocinitomicaceae bacterium]|jgi:16S rRNA (cytidine1402-2'-O)-methyltransferase
MAKGTIYMVPTTLGGETIEDVIPENVRKAVIELRYFIVEDIKSARRFLRKADRSFPIDESTFLEVHRRSEPHEIQGFLRHAIDGNSIGVLSDAGCPGIADPGAAVVALAHERNIPVKPLVGPSSILMTIMGSGFSGQEFTFHGYLPKERKDRIYAMKKFEGDVYRTGATHVFMDTPFRNMNVLEDLLNELSDTTMLCIACDLTIHDENIRTMSVKDWRKNAYDLAKKPTMFALGKLQ